MFIDSSFRRVGFIGLGIMGGPIASHILQGGYSLHVFNRSREKAAGLLQAGATWHADAASLARECDVVFTMLGFPRDVEEIYFGEHGLLAASARGTFLVDMTTSSPVTWRRIAEEGNKLGLACLDAPVTGGESGARRGQLEVFVGGEAAHFEALHPLFARFGNAVHQGPAGSGQLAKLANQIAIAGSLLGVVESLSFAKNANLDGERLLKSLERGAAASAQLSFAWPRALRGDFNPGFYAKHFLKDLNLALESARELGIDLRGVTLVRDKFRQLIELGHENLGTQALFLLQGIADDG